MGCVSSIGLEFQIEVLTWNSEAKRGSLNTIQVTDSEQGGVVREPG